MWKLFSSEPVVNPYANAVGSAYATAEPAERQPETPSQSPKPKTAFQVIASFGQNFREALFSNSLNKRLIDEPGMTESVTPHGGAQGYHHNAAMGTAVFLPAPLRAEGGIHIERLGGTSEHLNEAAAAAAIAAEEQSRIQREAHIDNQWKNIQALASQSFDVGAAVYVKRSDGSESLAYVKSFNTKNGLYKVELDAVGSGVLKSMYENGLRRVSDPILPGLLVQDGSAEVSPQKYPLDSQVWVKRSDGSESLAYVQSFNSGDGLYTLELDAVGSGLLKSMYEDGLRSVSDPPKPQKYPLGSMVYVQRSNGGESMACVRGYSKTKGVYRVELGDSSGQMKHAYEDAIRLADDAPPMDGSPAITPLMAPSAAPPFVGIQ